MINIYTVADHNLVALIWSEIKQKQGSSVKFYRKVVQALD